MSEVVNFLTDNPIVYLATVGRDGKAKCRPFMFCLEHDSKLWFCTSNKKDVYMDMQNNPNIEMSISNPAYAWLRISGKAVFENNIEVKEHCMQYPMIKANYGEATNPALETFYIGDVEAVITDFSGDDSARISI